MKQAISVLVAAMLLSYCGSHSNAMNDQQKAYEAIKNNIPGTVPVTADGYTMTVKMNGKEWTATSMMPPEASNRIIGYNNGEYIGLPYGRSYMVVGKKIAFAEDNAVDLTTNDDVSIWGGR